LQLVLVRTTIRFSIIYTVFVKVRLVSLIFFFTDHSKKPELFACLYQSPVEICGRTDSCVYKIVRGQGSSCEAMYHATLLLPFIFSLVATSAALNLCDQQNLFSTNLTSYKYKTEQVQNCNCTEKTTCIRKCCAVGFYASKGVCLRHDDPDYVLNIPVYQGKKFIRNVSAVNNILAGVMNCPFFPFKSNLTEWFYVQEDGKLLTSVYGQMSNDYFCVEDLKIENKTVLSAFICYDRNTVEITSRKIYAAGTILISTSLIFASIFM
jgi:hypothetical protein